MSVSNVRVSFVFIFLGFSSRFKRSRGEKAVELYKYWRLGVPVSLCTTHIHT